MEIRVVCRLLAPPDHVKGAIAMVVRSLPQSEQDALGEEIERRLQPYADGGGYRLPGMCLNVLAT